LMYWRNYSVSVAPGGIKGQLIPASADPQMW
jgi:hypothetical protein